MLSKCIENFPKSSVNAWKSSEMFRKSLEILKNLGKESHRVSLENLYKYFGKSSELFENYSNFFKSSGILKKYYFEAVLLAGNRQIKTPLVFMKVTNNITALHSWRVVSYAKHIL